jgi:hypothetical protein
LHAIAWPRESTIVSGLLSFSHPATSSILAGEGV